MLLALIALSVLPVQVPKDAQIKDLGDGYSRVTTSAYTIEVPKGWEVSDETPWGQRKAQPTEGSGELGVMTAPPSAQTLDELYRISLGFILREEQGKATPYKVTKTKSGLEAASFEVIDSEGFPSRRYVLLRHPTKGLLALSVKVPSRDADQLWSSHFKRLIESAKFAK